MSNFYANVPSRYLNPRKPTPEPPLPPKEVIPPSPAYAHVEPRYLSPRRGSPAAAGSASGTGGDNKKSKAKLKGHQPINKDALFPRNPKLAQVHARFLDPTNYLPRANSPRRVIELQHVADKRELGWRNDFVIGSCKLFEDLKPLTLEREKRAPSPKRAFKDTPSVVMSYIKDGIPIPHSSMQALIDKKREEESGRGGGGGPSSSHHTSRTSSPTRKWSSAGRQCLLFQEREAQTIHDQKQYQLEVKYVEQKVHERTAAKVSADHIPRVATLAPGYRLQELLHETREHLSAERQQRNDGNTPSPTQQPQHNLSLMSAGEYSHEGGATSATDAV